MTAYQPTWRDGRVLAAGERECADRYDAIRPVLAQVQQPFTLLDVGANGGYFAARAAAEFDCTVVAVDDHRHLHAVASDRVHVHPHRVDAGWLARQRRFDVVLALSVLHHMPDWRQVLGELQACRHAAIVEVPARDERWMQSAAARRELPAIVDATAAAAVERLGLFERTGRDGSIHKRPMFLLPGTVRSHTGTVFAGSGSCSRNLPRYMTAELPDALGYTPYPGSLNVRLPSPVTLGPPHVNWVGRNGHRTRDYQMWRAWHASGVPVHAMVPGDRGHGPDTLEFVAPDRLRDLLHLADGDRVVFDVEHCGARR